MRPDIFMGDIWVTALIDIVAQVSTLLRSFVNSRGMTYTP